MKSVIGYYNFLMNLVLKQMIRWFGDSLSTVLYTAIIYLVIAIIGLITMVYNFWFGLVLLLFGLFIATSILSTSISGIFVWVAYFYILITAFVATLIYPSLVRYDGIGAPLALSLFIGSLAATVNTFIIPIYLNYPRFSLEIQDAKIVGQKKAQDRLSTTGGPGHLFVSQQDAVILQRRINDTRVVSGLKVLVRPHEKLKTIVSLDHISGVKIIENMLTQDRVYMRWKVAYKAHIETIQETRERLEIFASRQDNKQPRAEYIELNRLIEIVKNGDKIGLEPYDHYSEIIQLASSTNPHEIIETFIEINSKNYCRSHNIEDLFTSDMDTGDIQTRVDSSPFTQIESWLRSNFNDGNPSKVIVLDAVNITGIDIQESIKNDLDKQNLQAQSEIMSSNYGQNRIDLDSAIKTPPTYQSVLLAEVMLLDLGFAGWLGWRFYRANPELSSYISIVVTVLGLLFATFFWIVRVRQISLTNFMDRLGSDPAYRMVIFCFTTILIVIYLVSMVS